MKYIYINSVIACLIFITSINAKDRIISAGGSITEIMYELGLGEHIVAVDSSSYFPFEAGAKPKVGYFRRLSAEGVLSLNPSQLIASNGAGPDEALLQISNAGVEVKVFKQEIYTLESWKNYIREVGTYFNLLPLSNKIIKRVEDSIQGIESSKLTQDKSAILLMDLGDRGPVAAGKNTVPDMLFKLAKVKNIANDYEGYKPFSPEKLIQLKPDFLVIPSHVAEKMGGKEMICNNQIISLATREQGCNVLIMDALLALGFGPRIDQAVKVLFNYEY